jgi:integrase
MGHQHIPRLGTRCDLDDGFDLLTHSETPMTSPLSSARPAPGGRTSRIEGRGRDGLPDVGLYTLRHSAASVMRSRDIPLEVVSDVPGDSSTAITGLRTAV